MTAEEIDRLPKGRSFQSIAMTAPSVNSGEIEGGFQVNGASGAENAFTVDGVVTNSLINGSSRQNTVFEYLQEVQVKTTGIPAEYGGALGGVISAVTKSGGNTFTGEAHYYLDGIPAERRPGQAARPRSVDERRFTYGRTPSSPTSQRDRRIARRSDPRTSCSSSDRSRRGSIRTNDYRFSNGTEEGAIERTSKFIQAFGKVSYSGRRITAYVLGARDADHVGGHAAGLQRLRPDWVIASSMAANDLNLERGFEQTQTNANGNVDIVMSNRSFLSARGGVLPRQLQRHGHPGHDELHLPDAVGGLGCDPGQPAGTVGTQNTPRA